MTIRTDSKGHIRATSTSIQIGHQIVVGNGQTTSYHDSNGDKIPAGSYAVRGVELADPVGNYRGAKRMYRFVLESADGTQYGTKLHGPSKTHRILSADPAEALTDGGMDQVHQDAVAQYEKARAAVAEEATPSRRARLHECTACLAEIDGLAQDERAGVAPEIGYTVEYTASRALSVEIDGHGTFEVTSPEKVVHLLGLGREQVAAEVADRLDGMIGYGPEDVARLPMVALVAMAGDFRDGADMLEAEAERANARRTGVDLEAHIRGTLERVERELAEAEAQETEARQRGNQLRAQAWNLRQRLSGQQALSLHEQEPGALAFG